MPKVRTIPDVVSRQLCCGCGACSYLAPNQLAMIDDLDHGRRPILLPLVDASRTAPLVESCPGATLRRPAPAPAARSALLDGWGSVVGLWEGWAADPDLRYRGSSGGAASALAVHGMAALGFHGVLHTAAREDVPYLNRTTLSTSPDEVRAAAGARYAPASPCDGLAMVENAPGPCVVIGKPCDIGGVEMARRSRPRLDERVGLTIAVFCAGTPTTRGTLEMLRAMGFPDPAAVRSVRYRGRGWPGDAAAEGEVDGQSRAERLDYAGSWGRILQRHRQWRCHLCPDHTGELADVSVGDPWHRPIEPGDPGRSLIVARTERGRAFVESAIAAGRVVLTPVEDDVLPASQPNLLKARGAVAGRIRTLRLLGVAAPRFAGFPMRSFWWSQLSMREKLRSTLGTARRVRRRRLRSAVAISPVGEDA